MIETSLPRPTRELIDRLVEEIRCYLDAVETFRREGCEPRWARPTRPQA